MFIVPSEHGTRKLPAASWDIVSQEARSTNADLNGSFFYVSQKKKIAMESYEFEVLNEVYLQNFLYRWVVNRETNLMMLINS